MLICITYMIGLAACNSTPSEVETREPTVEPIPDTLKFLHIPLNDKKIDHGVIKSGQILSEILEPYGVSGHLLSKMSVAYKNVFDVRKIRHSEAYSILYTEDSIKQATHFVYRENPWSYIVFQFKDSQFVYRHLLPVDTIQKSIGLRIHGSLIETFNKNQISGELGFRLSEILAWQIDFFKIQKDDWVKVVYEELHCQGKYAALGKIIAVEFNWMGESYFGINYVQDIDNQYFDQNGKSLRKAFLKAPLDYSRISSRYTMKRFHPVQKIWKAHLGTDYAAPHGTPIRTVGDGIVIESGYGRGNGNYVKIKHNQTITTQYLHMSRIHPTARKGRHVKQGQVIGYVGSTGLATGPHLCFRFWQNGRQVDPFKVKTPPTIPILETHKAAFETIKIQRLAQLKGIQLLD